MTNRHILTEAEIQTLLHGFDGRQTTDIDPVSPPSNTSPFTQPREVDPTSDSNLALNNIQAELRQLRSLMASTRSTNTSPLRAKIFERLSSLGFHAIASEKILAGIALSPDEKVAWQQILFSLESQLPIAADNIIDQSGVIAFVGPTGSGKTTLIAKIATQFTKRHNPQDIGLITTDYYSVCGRDELTIYGNILDIPVHRVNSTVDLKQALDHLQGKRLILIDTPGLSQRALDFNQKLNILSHSPRSVKTILTLAANTHELVLNEIIHAFNQNHLSGISITKIDEAPFIGHVLSACIDHQLPIVALTNGQHIPDNFINATLEKVLSLAIKKTAITQHSFVQKSEALV